MNWYYHKKIGLDIPYFWRQILSMTKGLVIPMIAGLCIMRFADITTWSRILFYGVLYVVIYCASMWLLGMNDYERNLLLKPVAKLLHRA